jgi:putative DNA primase/helicase
MQPPDFDKIPPELTAHSQWVCWSFEERKGKVTKVPKNPQTGGNAKSDAPDTWGTYAQALNHYEALKGNGIAGIGFMFSFYDRFTGVDIDHCRDPETGQLKYCAQVLIEYLDSYSEASPSGTGIHTITKARWPENAGNKKIMPCGMEIEVYDRLRYFTVTGHLL